VQTDQLTSYIKNARTQGLSDAEIKANLIAGGWSEDMVNQGLSGKSTLVVPPPPVPTPPSSASQPKGSLTMWDAFEHILLFISLYVLATSLALTLHYFVDKWFSGIGSDSSSYSWWGGFGEVLLRGYLAALIVSFPLFAFLFTLITQRTMRNPALRSLGARKVLIYLTLIGTFIIMLCNVIATVFAFLNGNVTFNFGLHFLVTVGISGYIFAYYVDQVREDRRLHE